MHGHADAVCNAGQVPELARTPLFLRRQICPGTAAALCCGVRHRAVSSSSGRVLRGEKSSKRRQGSTEVQSLQEPDQGSLNLPPASVNLESTPYIFEG